jgi:hypothetical protein
MLPASSPVRLRVELVAKTLKPHEPPRPRDENYLLPDHPDGLAVRNPSAAPNEVSESVSGRATD